MAAGEYASDGSEAPVDVGVGASSPLPAVMTSRQSTAMIHILPTFMELKYPGANPAHGFAADAEAAACPAYHSAINRAFSCSSVSPVGPVNGGGSTTSGG